MVRFSASQIWDELRLREEPCKLYSQPDTQVICTCYAPMHLPAQSLAPSFYNMISNDEDTLKIVVQVSEFVGRF